MPISIAIIAAAGALQAAASPAAAEMPPEPIGKHQMAYPFPAPDDRSIVVQGNFDGRWQLYTIGLEQGDMRRLHTSSGDDTHPAWSPDGSSLAFISNRDGNDEVYVLDLATGTARSVSPHPGKDGHPKWSGDGQWLVFNRTFDPGDKGGDGDSAIMRVRADGSGLATISDTPRVETFPSFSPDAKSIVLVEWFANAGGERNRNGELVVVDLTTGARRNITNSDVFDAYPYWGSSGDWIYFSTSVDDRPGSRDVAVHRIRPNGRDLERLTPLDGIHDARPIPSRDETRLYFNMLERGRTDVRRIAISPK